MYAKDECEFKFKVFVTFKSGLKGPGLPRGVTSKDLFHVTDWLPTLLSAAGQLTEQKAQIISN